MHAGAADTAGACRIDSELDGTSGLSGENIPFLRESARAPVHRLSRTSGDYVCGIQNCFQLFHDLEPVAFCIRSHQDSDKKSHHQLYFGALSLSCPKRYERTDESCPEHPYAAGTGAAAAALSVALVKLSYI